MLPIDHFMSTCDIVVDMRDSPSYLGLDHSHFPPIVPSRQTWLTIHSCEILVIQSKRGSNCADEADFKEKSEGLRKELALWEDVLSKSPYLAGDDFTLADVAAGTHWSTSVSLQALFGRRLQ